VYPTLAEVLDLPVLRAAAPRVRAGSAGLDVPVRWVHVSEQRDPAGTLSGGELVLASGVAVSDPTGDPAAYVAALRDAGAVGLVVELGQHVRSLPTALVQAARAAEFPLVELTRAVRYVEVTEIVHARILNSQYARMQFLQRVHDTFRTLTVESGELSRVLAEAAALTGLRSSWRTWGTGRCRSQAIRPRRCSRTGPPGRVRFPPPRSPRRADPKGG